MGMFERALVGVYADQKETWLREHKVAQSCFDLEERLRWGVWLFRGLLEEEARLQARAIQVQDPALASYLEDMPQHYRSWLETSEFYAQQADELAHMGYTVDGIVEFQETLEEARCLLGNWEYEDNLRPIEDLLPQAQPDNPRPDRYGD